MSYIPHPMIFFVSTESFILMLFYISVGLDVFWLWYRGTFWTESSLNKNDFPLGLIKFFLLCINSLDERGAFKNCPYIWINTTKLLIFLLRNMMESLVFVYICKPPALWIHWKEKSESSVSTNEMMLDVSNGDTALFKKTKFVFLMMYAQVWSWQQRFLRILDEDFVTFTKLKGSQKIF